jgi:hypothetical protein
MSNGKITWYSRNSDLAVEERGPIELDEALTLVDRYRNRSRPGDVFWVN